MTTDRIWLTLAIFVLTLFLVLARPRGLHEAWATVIGGGLMFLTGAVSIPQALSTIGSGLDVLIFLLALMLYAVLLERSGFFDWAAAWSVRLSRGNTRVLYRNVFIVGAFTTALLSLDTTAVVLTPVVVAFVGKLKLREAPFLLACAFISNTASLLMPVSNLTNLIYLSQFHFSFMRFVAIMAGPQIIALGVNYGLFRYLFRRELKGSFEPSQIPAPAEEIRDPFFFRAGLVSLLFVLVGYFAGSLLHIPPYVTAFGACSILLAAGFWRRSLEWRIASEITWSLFPFVVGLFVVVRAVQNLPILSAANRFLADSHIGPFTKLATVVAATGLGSNVVNNIPAALVSVNALHAAHSSEPLVYGALIGCNIGPNLTVFGSLATMLVISSARRRGIEVSAWTFFRVGLIVMPLILVGSALPLLLL